MSLGLKATCLQSLCDKNTSVRLFICPHSMEDKHGWPQPRLKQPFVSSEQPISNSLSTVLTPIKTRKHVLILNFYQPPLASFHCTPLFLLQCSTFFTFWDQGELGAVCLPSFRIWGLSFSTSHWMSLFLFFLLKHSTSLWTPLRCLFYITFDICCSLYMNIIFCRGSHCSTLQYDPGFLTLSNAPSITT